MNMKRTATFGLLLLSLVITAVLSRPLAAEPEAPDPPPAAAPNWTGDEVLLSDGTNADSTRPFVQGGPDGNSVTVVYTSQLAGDTNRNPYYNESTDNGEIWSGMLPIHISGNDAGSVRFTYDASGNRHAVWREQLAGGGSVLLYKPESSWGATQAVTITQSANLPGVFTPHIIASGTNLLDIVWAQGDISNPNIFHARKIGSGSWTSQVVKTSSPISSNPSLVVDQSGKLHAVWQEVVGGGAGTSAIYYAQGTPGGGSSITWSDITVISAESIPSVTDAKQPAITTDGQTLFVSFTDRVDKNEQSVHVLSCGANCTNANNWTPAVNPISNQLLGVNANDPFDVSSNIILMQKCIHVYYHAFIAGFSNDNEIISGNNSCDGWAESAADQVTANNVRSIFPVLAQHNNWFMYIVYEQIDEGVSNIYFMRNDPAVYLPFISKE